MPSTARPTSPQKSHATVPKKKFRTVLGFNPILRDSSDTDSQTPPSPGLNLTFARKSIDTARSYTYRRKQRVDRASVTNISFFQREPKPADIIPPNNAASIVDLTTDTMKTLDATLPHPSSRRPPVRMDAQDGPWSVSVAETPHDARSYSLYIRTPTHNLTLTRTAMEIVELDQKLRESHPGAKLPAFPIDANGVPTPPPKRKSTFLNTLSRLASPASNKVRNVSSPRRGTNMSSPTSTLPTPLTSPSSEVGDPFSSFTASSIDAAAVVLTPSANSTGVAAYLTTISNTPSLRQARVWKRFVRVRTDDLESVRVERAIKHVRSDLAAHVGLTKENGLGGSVTPAANAVPSETGSIPDGNSDGLDGHEADHDVTAPKAKEEGVKEDEDAATVDGIEVASKASDEAPEVPAATAEKLAGVTAESVPPNEETPSSPVTSEAPSRIHRSQSADPDKSSRLSRAFTSSAPTQDLSPGSQTGDESSISTTGNSRRRSRKKRSMSMDPNKELLKKKSQRKVVIDDFEMMRVLGKGCAGKVLLVKHKSTADLYALKAITKRHVLAHQELQHTLTEQAVLKKMAAESKDPFVVKLWWSFHDKENLFLVMDFHPGGDLATQLARWGRLGRDRARFYAAEIVEGVEGLHAAGVIYRDLKPENILIGADGHIVLTDFGLSKEFPRRTATLTAPSTPSGSRAEFYSSVPGTPQLPATPPWMKTEKGGEMASGWPGQPIGQSDSTTTFCGTAEYLAPEVIQGLSYSYEVDWWSFGTMLYEMLTGITPFWANNHSDMYVRVLQDELSFPDDRAIDQDTKSLIRGLLQRNPGLRICEPRIKKHPYFSMIDWSHVYYKRYIPPYIPPIDPSNASDTQNFDDTFLDMEPVLDDVIDNEQTDTDQEQTDTDRTDGEESNTTPSQSRSSSIRPVPQPEVDDSVDVFDGYSFKGRHSILIDDEEEEEESEEESEEGSAILQDLQLESPPAPEVSVDEEVAEPKTPEARPAVLPEPVVETAPAPPPKPPVAAEPSQPPAPEATAPAPPQTKDLPPIETSAPPLPDKNTTVKITTPVKVSTARPIGNRSTRPRREKSGVPALDRYLSDGIDEDNNATEKEDDEDDDWDFVEAADGEDRNGAKGNSLFARGVVDRYRLAVFRKASTPSQRSAPRSFSGMSKESDVTVAELPADSPSPSQRRGRTPLTFRKHPRQFLRPKSPPSSFSSKSSGAAKSLSQSQSNTFSAASTASISGLLTPSPSVGSTLPTSPSLKSKESATSVGNNSHSSDQSGNIESSTAEVAAPPDTIKGTPVEEPEKQKNKKLKKYKENAEKVFSLFSSPRQPS